MNDMTDKVIDSLTECVRQHRFDCTNCEYQQTDSASISCINNLMADALIVIKQQKERLRP